MCVLVARDDALDTYLVHHPDALFGRSVEATVLDPSNPYVLAQHLCCAAAELPLVEDDLELFGGSSAVPVLDALVAQGSLRRRPTGWYWAGEGRPDVDPHGTGGTPGPVGLVLGDVEVTNQVVGYQRRRLSSREVIDTRPLNLAPRQLHTVAVSWTASPRALGRRRRVGRYAGRAARG